MVGNFRDELGKTFVAAGEEFPSLVVVTADVSKSTRSILFKEKWPERFFSVGIAEANAVSIAAGISSFNHPVIFTAYGVFATEKPFEQIRNTICYPEMNVKIVATHGGISVGEDGATHQAIEDIAIMRAIPKMKVIVAADPGEVKAAVFEAIRTPGPVYVRLGRGVGGVIHQNPDEVTLSIGKAEKLRDGDDVTLIGAGVMVEQCLFAAEKLQQAGISAAVLNIRTVKPIDVEAIKEAVKKTGAIVTAEDHNCYGGVFGAVAEAVTLNCPAPMERIALEDTFGESGNGKLLLEKYGLTADRICTKAKEVIKRKQQEAK
ncbi:MAG: transketolase family protein [Flexilinea sp.]